jgi:sRNA-binding protein
MNPEAEAPAKHWRTAARWLKREYWPVFGRGYPPLAIGIHREIIANPKRPARITGRMIRKAIYVRTQHDKYLMALIERDADSKSIAKRYDLKGKPVGPVAPKDIKAALTTWRERRKRRDAERYGRAVG